MNRLRRIEVQLFLLLVCSLSPLSLAAAQEPTAGEEFRFVRFIDGDEQWQGELQTAIVSFKNSKGVQLNLVAAIHLGETAYYEGLNDYFLSQDVVLYELVAEANQIPVRDNRNNSPSVIGFIQQVLANFLDIGFQLNEINYSVDNFLHADLTPSQLTALMASNNENFFTMFLNLALAQMAYKQTTSNSNSLSSFNMLSLLSALNADNQNNVFKYLFARELGRSGGVIVGAELEQQLTMLGDRNDAALRVLREALRNEEYQQISIFYGAAHMPGIEREISSSMGFNRTNSQWQSAWVIP